MDTIACIQAPPVRKGKKKQAKDEVDRLKQAEKKKRRLEKALATSAAIRSELEKKKQKKKEEQQRLDEEGAAIAEAVAMHVLLGEDSDESCKILLQQDEGFNPWNRASNIGLFMGGRKAGPGNQGYTRYSLEGLGRVSDVYGGMACKWNDWGIGRWSLSQDIFGKERHAPYFEERIRGTTEISAGLIAAQAVSSLQIAEDVHVESNLINRMLRSIVVWKIKSGIWACSYYVNLCSCICHFPKWKVATDLNGHSKGYGYVQFEQEEAAQNAIKGLDGMLMNDIEISVGLFVRKQERHRADGSEKDTNLYVKNFSETLTDEDLKKIFSAYGTITHASVMKDVNSGKSKGFGFVKFEKSDDAASAIEKMNGYSHNDKVWYVGLAKSKTERKAELKSKFEQESSGKVDKLQGANLYLKNLDDDFSDEKLKELFSQFGTIISHTIKRDMQGQSMGYGFVAFSTPEDAAKAVNEMNGKMIGRKPLYVAVAQRKEERKARLQAHFAQIRAPGMTPLPFGMPGLHPGGPRLGHQQLYFGQGSPGSIPPHPAAYGYQQPFLPGFQPSVHPNYMIPYHLQRQGQPGQRMGVRRGGDPTQMQQQQMMQRNNLGYRYMTNARNGLDPSIVRQGRTGTMIPLPLDASVTPVAPVDEPLSEQTLTSALASASPEKQHVILGERLFPLVKQLQPQSPVSKITGMLLEMDQREVLHLIESPDALKKKVGEAVDVLQAAAYGSADASDQLNSLSLSN